MAIATIGTNLPIVFLDAIYFNVRQDSRIVNKAAYTVLGINSSGGHKDILGGFGLVTRKVQVSG